MKNILLFILLFVSSSNSDGLFDNVEFNEKGIAYLINIPVTLEDIGKTVNEQSMQSLEKSFKSTTSLSFIYNNMNYYLPIEEESCNNFLLDLNEGDLLFIDIVVFNSRDCYSKRSKKNYYCSYINKIRR